MNLKDMTLEQCCQAVTDLRAAGKTGDLQKVEAWIAEKYPPKPVTGHLAATIKVPGLH